ncbi:MAG: DNA-directed RNA polymerase specialized sigma24 family protein, partial [Planctomycetota bacterium]
MPINPSPIAFDPELLAEHADWVCKLAHSLLRDPATAADLIQGTWMAALRQPPEPGREPPAWLAT